MSSILDRIDRRLSLLGWRVGLNLAFHAERESHEHRPVLSDALDSDKPVFAVRMRHARVAPARIANMGHVYNLSR